MVAAAVTAWLVGTVALGVAGTQSGNGWLTLAAFVSLVTGCGILAALLDTGRRSRGRG